MIRLYETARKLGNDHDTGPPTIKSLLDANTFEAFYEAVSNIDAAAIYRRTTVVAQPDLAGLLTVTFRSIPDALFLQQVERMWMRWIEGYALTGS